MCDVYLKDKPYKNLFDVLSEEDNVGNCTPLYEYLRFEKVELRNWHDDVIDRLPIKDFLNKRDKYNDIVQYVKFDNENRKIIIYFY
jgi:hypothetical protein